MWYIDSFDLYAYAAFDPINNWDPTGMASAGIGATGQGQRSLGAPGGLGPRSQAAEEFEWARSGFAIHYGPSQSPGGHISRARTPLYQTLGEGAQPPQPPRPRAELLPAYTRQPRASFARVTRDGDDISIHVNLYFRSPVGVEITDDMIATWVNTAEQVWTGEFGRYHVTTNITPRRGRRPINRLRWRGHEVLVYEAVFRHRGQERIAEFNRKNGQIRISANVTGFVFSHEFGHALGQGDRYYKSSDVERDIKRNNPWPGWEGNIMTTAPNKGQGEVWEENITHILETHKLSAP